MSEHNDPRLITLEPPCFYCKHLTEMGLQDGDAPEALDGWVCPAFPDGIWKMILRRKVSHAEEQLGQTGDKVFKSNEYNIDGETDTISFDGQWASWGKK